eukprot:TRINITY_DN4403_c0_g1_i5.p1 TRINITY_DN4403_c0_g1~~TRINITY_DN4403_c0_g1_i5.p1  ORF type:complete len:598 (-),score=108.95 TRINITY_DN4403_c0_g1_i5:228-2021(-)
MEVVPEPKRSGHSRNPSAAAIVEVVPEPKRSGHARNPSSPHMISPAIIEVVPEPKRSGHSRNPSAAAIMEVVPEPKRSGHSRNASAAQQIASPAFRHSDNQLNEPRAVVIQAETRAPVSVIEENTMTTDVEASTHSSVIKTQPSTHTPPEYTNERRKSSTKLQSALRTQSHSPGKETKPSGHVTISIVPYIIPSSDPRIGDHSDHKQSSIDDRSKDYPENSSPHTPINCDEAQAKILARKSYTDPHAPPPRTPPRVHDETIGLRRNFSSPTLPDSEGSFAKQDVVISHRTERSSSLSMMIEEDSENQNQQSKHHQSPKHQPKSSLLTAAIASTSSRNRPGQSGHIRFGPENTGSSRREGTASGAPLPQTFAPSRLPTTQNHGQHQHNPQESSRGDQHAPPVNPAVLRAMGHRRAKSSPVEANPGRPNNDSRAWRRLEADCLRSRQVEIWWLEAPEPFMLEVFPQLTVAQLIAMALRHIQKSFGLAEGLTRDPLAYDLHLTNDDGVSDHDSEGLPRDKVILSFPPSSMFRLMQNPNYAFLLSQQKQDEPSSSQSRNPADSEYNHASNTQQRTGSRVTAAFSLRLKSFKSSFLKIFDKS